MHDDRTGIDSPATNPALRAMLEGKTDLAETRLSVTASQIVDRMRIRASHLKELMSEELTVDSKLRQIRNGFPDGQIDLFGLESLLENRNSQIRSARRRENTECWRDLAHVMRDFLNAWEGFSKNEAKNRFLESLPSSNTLPNTSKPSPEQALPVSGPYIQNDYRNPIPYNQR